MTELLRPAAAWELQSMLEGLAARKLPVEVVGGGSKRAIGRPVRAAAMISTGSMRGVSLYEPTELVMSARAGTSLAQVEAELASRGQMLAFEPIDPGPAIGLGAGRQTVGGIFACNLSGARRIAAGAARDHLLGIKAVNGRGELFQSGGRVLKNVTGYDLPRGLSGSWGTLAVITDLTFKVLPAPEETATLAFAGLPDDLGVDLMCAAVGSPYDVSGAVHLPEGIASRLESETLAGARNPITAVRIEGSRNSVALRGERLFSELKVYGNPIRLDDPESAKLWAELRRLSIFPYGPSLLWRISTAPSAAPALVAAIRRNMEAEAFYDWSGGLIWIETPPSADAGASDIRRLVASHGGHATLIRAEANIREVVEVFHPCSPAVERLTRALKAAFDPAGILNPGRMYAMT